MNPDVNGNPIKPSNNITKADMSNGYFSPSPEKSSILTFLLLKQIKRNHY